MSRAKAEYGPGSLVYARGGVPMSGSLSNQQKLMQVAQELYHKHPWIRAAEGLISRKFSSQGWHLARDDEKTSVTDLETLLKGGAKQQNLTFRALRFITCRHAGLCNNAFWYLDSPDLARGRPADIIYINPARMTPVPDRNGYLDFWVVDADPWTGQGGTRFNKDEILWFQFEPADVGFFGHGLVYSAMLKAQLSMAADAHALDTLEAGGRMTGVMTPEKDGYFTDAQFQATEKALRTVTEQEDSAKRMVLLRKPVEIHEMTMSPDDLELLGIAKMTRDDIYEIWGVPRSQTGGISEIGMNSGDRLAYEEAALQQNAIHPRAQMFSETIQKLVDRYDPSVTYVTEEPTYDDERPKYEMLKLAEMGPLSRDERRAIVGLPPLGGDDGSIIDQTPGLLQVVPPLPISRSTITGRLQDGWFVEQPNTAPNPDTHLDQINDARNYRGDQNVAIAKAMSDLSAVVTARIAQKSGHLAQKGSDVDAILPATALSALPAPVAAEVRSAMKAMLADGLDGLEARVKAWFEDRYPAPEPDAAEVLRQQVDALARAMKAAQPLFTPTRRVIRRDATGRINEVVAIAHDGTERRSTVMRDEHGRVLEVVEA